MDINKKPRGIQKGDKFTVHSLTSSDLSLGIFKLNTEYTATEVIKELNEVYVGDKWIDEYKCKKIK